MCGDTFAARFLDDEVRAQIRPLLDQSGPSASNVARHVLIDEALREALETDPARRVILLGAGFDTRAFRLTGGRWWEFDSAELLDFKEQRLPAATAPNPVVRVAVDLSDGRLGDHLAPLAGDDEAIVVMEGVSMYLAPAALTATAHAVRTHLPNATFICDVMSPAFCRRFSRSLRRELSRRGAEFQSGNAHPAESIREAGYRAASSASIVARARQAGTVRIPGWLLATFLRELRDGYQVWTFKPVRT